MNNRMDRMNQSFARYSRVLLFTLLIGSLLFCLPLAGPSGKARDGSAAVEAVHDRKTGAIGALGALVAMEKQFSDVNLEATGILADAVLEGPEGWEPAGAAAPAVTTLPQPGGEAPPAAAAKDPVEEDEGDLEEVSGDAAGLPVPSGLTVTQYGEDYLLQWNPVNDSRVAGYNVYRSFFSSPKMRKGKRLNSSPLQVTSYFDTSVKNRKRKQYYSVASVDLAARPGPRSDGVAVLPWLPDASPPAPVGAVDSGFLEEGLSAAWNAANREPDFNGYNLYLSDAPGRQGSRLNDQPVRDTFFFAEGVQAGTGPRYLTVRSVDTSGNESAPAQAAPEPVPFRFYEEDSPEMIYGGLWKRERYPEAHGGAITVANDAGAWSELTFTGRSVKVYSANYWTCGETRIYLDGVLVATVDQFSDGTRYGVLTYRNYALRPGTHVIRIVATGRASSTEQVPGYHFTNWDYLQVH